MRLRQQEIISALEVQSTIDPVAETERRISLLSSHLVASSIRGYVLGISGGQDSLLAGTLAQRAVERSRMNGHKATFYALLLPYGKQRDRDDALAACDFIRPDKIIDLDIKPAVDTIIETFETAIGEPTSDFNKGNVKARMRMIAHYLLSGHFPAVRVLGTDHAAESVTGFFTKYGDGGADLLPLAGLTKRQGKALLRELGAPEHLITKAPTADLLDSTPGQTDETELGISYDQLDDYLEGKTIDDVIAQKIEQRYDVTMHKRHQPLSINMTSGTLES